MTFDIAADDLRLLAEVGFLGIGRGRFDEAEAIFALLRRMRPDQEAGYVGGALAAMSGGRLEQSAQMLRSAPQTESVLAFRALVHERAGDKRLAAGLIEDLGFMRASPAVMEIAEAVTGA